LIGWLRGAILSVDSERITLDVGGVGYEVACTFSLISAAMVDGSKQIELFVHTHVAEDRLDLYGFPDAESRNAFRVLIGLSGVGPKSGLQILSDLGIEELNRAIALEDYPALQRVKGIGKKMAQKICLELAERGVVSRTGQPSTPKKAGTKKSSTRNDALLALKSLGFPPKSAIQAVETVLAEKNPPDNVGDLVTRALQTLTPDAKG
jgi:Holliday junction DNA helicase RuvA